jgi:lipoyl(octanoyl) transferase
MADMAKIKGAKIASLGLRVKNQCCYHGLSLNVAMDLTPFSAIHPCGYMGLKVTQCADVGIAIAQAVLANQLVDYLSLSPKSGA